MEASMKARFIAISLICTLFIPLQSMAAGLSIKFFVGDVKLIRNKTAIAVKVGDLVSSGDIIKTGKNSMAELQVDVNSTITIMANSKVLIGSSNLKDSDFVSVIAGEVKGKFGKLSRSEYKMGSPTTICAIRGTEFNIAVSDIGDSYVELSEGNLSVRNPYKNIELKEGNSLEADVANEPISSSTKINSNQWKDVRNSNFDGDYESPAQRYESYMDKFQEKAKNDSQEISLIKDDVKKSKTKEDLEQTGQKLYSKDSELEDSLLMNELSLSNMENIVEENKSASLKFKGAVKKGKAVLDQQIKNKKAIDKVKEDYKAAYDRIMKKFGEDKSNILKNLEDYKKKQQEEKEQ
jgi:hypothetical protein